MENSEGLSEELERLLHDPEIAIEKDWKVHQIIYEHLRLHPEARVTRKAYLNLYALFNKKLHSLERVNRPVVIEDKTSVNKPRSGYLTKAHIFGSHYDQADGTDVEYPAGTPVRILEAVNPGSVWIAAPNGREALVTPDLLTYEENANV